ncbi:MAG: phosphoenolpyruvate--protein phosphotransferase [Gammaproteobacteria bacterium]|nr:phosphoenolpyruvate--protein phosphotransferase [Gammaproteobacteria bacterium]
MTICCTGIAIGTTRGIAIGEVHLLQRGCVEITPRFIDAASIPDEVDRFCQAVSIARRQLRSVRNKIPNNTHSDIVAFIDTHMLILNDAALVEMPIEHIKEKCCGAEWALQLQRDMLVQMFDEMEDTYLRTRKDDVDHAVNQIQQALRQEVEEEENEDLQGKIILAQDLTPADTILMRHLGIAAFVTESGGPMSHTAILARSLGIPAVVGVHHATRHLHNGELTIVDGEKGMVLVAADEGTLSHYRHRIEVERQHARSLQRLIGEPSVTIDGTAICLMANIELPEDIDATREIGADGVGLYRTEYLFVNRNSPPDEEEHYQAYLRVVEGLDGIPVTIRTLDLGADKQFYSSHLNPESSVCNPALGLRAIRLCLKKPELFYPQLRAILRVAAHGPVRIMIPMLCNLWEVYQLKAMIEEARMSLTRQGVSIGEPVPIGGMIEVPAAALAAGAFAKELDFISIGTNDLIQYTLAIDRVDDEVNYLYDPLHPSVLRLIKMILDAGERHQVPVSMCGEMAGDPLFLPLLLGMGLREFSMQPGALLEVKKTIRTLDSEKLSGQVSHLLSRLDDAETAVELSRISHTRNSWPAQSS